MKHSKLCAVLLALVMAVSLAMPAAAEGETLLISSSPKKNDIVILHTNDVHCGIGDGLTYAGVAAYRNEMAAQYGQDYVTLVDAGDAIQGGPIGTLTDGSALVDLMNYMGYDIAIPGNHEFDYGMDSFLSLVKDEMEYTYLCCNFMNESGNSILDGYTVRTYGDTKVGFVGIDTPETFVKSTPTYFQDANGNYIYSFCEGNNGQDLYNQVQKSVDAAIADGADYVVAIAHLGLEETSKPWRSTDVIANTTGIDVMIDGHSHSTVAGDVYKNKAGKDVVLTQAGTKLAALGKVVIDPTADTITSELITDYAGRDADVQAYVDQLNAKFEETLNSVVAKSEVTLTTVDPAAGNRIIRNSETNLGDLCADAYRTLLGADIAFVNGGGIRANIAQGDITYSDIINVHPYGNEACMIEATGQQILDALELGAMNNPGESGGFLQVSGLTYTIDTTIPSSVQQNDKKEFVGITGARRVKDVMVGGVALDPAKTYTLASHNYMLKDGGDGYTMFKNDKIILDCVMIDNQVLIDYIVKNLGGVVGQEYANPYGQGRITVLTQAVAEPTPETQPEPTPAVHTYIVEKGDSLWRIASEQLGYGTRWSEIYRLNSDIIKNPSRIYPGQELKLPA